MDHVYDLIIVGSGPAGLAAAIYAARAELDYIVIERSSISGGQVLNTYEVDNYPGLPMISGFDLSEKLRAHADRLGAHFITGEVSELSVNTSIKTLRMDNGYLYQCRAIIIATGAKSRKLGVPGEHELSGMGVSYCATCDGAFFKNRVTAVVGGGDVAVEDAIFLARGCKQVYVIHRRHEFRAAKTLVSKLMQLSNVTVIWDSVVTKINGDDCVRSINIKNIQTNEITELPLHGVFIAIGNMPNSSAFTNVVDSNKDGYLLADETGATSIPGVFAAGDVRNKVLRQIITAAADGANAVASVEKYLIMQ